MTGAEIQTRVDAWIRHRSEAGWFDDADRRFLRDQWRDVAHRHGADTDAARGVLLGLVREAFGEPSIYACTWREYKRVNGETVDDGIAWIVTWQNAPGYITKAREEFDALVLALEAKR